MTEETKMYDVIAVCKRFFCAHVFLNAMRSWFMAGCEANTKPLTGEYARRLVAVLSARPPND